MIKKIILSGLGLIPFILSAQLTINVQLPPAGFVQKDQLWNLILVNNNNGLLDVSIKMDLKDAATGEVLLSANTGNIVIGKGVKIIKAADAQPVLYNYTSPDFDKSYLPMGAYIACYHVYENKGESPLPLGEECSSLTIDPLSPPLLNSPADQSEIETPYPQFSWMPPTPYDMFSNLRYELIVTEVLEGQSPTEAIGYNTPVYVKGNILSANEIYPSTLEKLDTGKVYAWQVTALNGLNYAAKTEVWTFTMRKETKPGATLRNDSYISLQTGTEGTYIVHKNSLHVKFYSFERAQLQSFVFSDEKGNRIYQADKKLLPGDNYLDFDIGQHFQTGKTYRLSATDKNNKKYTLIFSIQ